MPKFFVDKNNISDSKVILNGDDIKHITKVLRKNLGDELELFDGSGGMYKVKIMQISKDEIIAEILEKQFEKTNNIQITLYQSLPKANKMELVIQKCTELGIYKIIPFTSKRTIVILDSERDMKKKVERWQKIADEACKQCNRSTIPIVDNIKTFNQVIEDVSSYDLSLVAYENETERLKNVLIDKKECKNISIIIGPEGGFEKTEIDDLVAKGVKSISLGKRILRTETAGMALLGILMYEYNEIG